MSRPLEGGNSMRFECSDQPLNHTNHQLHWELENYHFLRRSRCTAWKKCAVEPESCLSATCKCEVAAGAGLAENRNRGAVTSCDSRNPVFYEDEVDIHPNPKVGADWGLRGLQRKVVTSDQNKKYFLSGALQATTGQVIYIFSLKKSTILFIDLLRALRRRCRSSRTFTPIVDN